MSINRDQVIKKIYDALKNVYDPEIPVNIVDLGLVYDVLVDDSMNVKVKMTLTAPGCPIANLVLMQAKEAIKDQVPEVKDVEIQLVWDPPWTPDRISEDGRKLLKEMFGYDVVEEWKRRIRELSGS